MILLTGATGLVGSHLLYALLLRGEKVRATKRESSNLNNVNLAFSFYGEKAKNLLQQVEWVDADLQNPAEVEEIMVGINRVFHCAATVSFRPKDKYNMLRETPAITSNLVNATLTQNVKHFAHVSSVAAIGRTKETEEIITEETEWKNGPENSNYAESKYLAELEVWRGLEEGLCAGIINPTIILGPGNWNASSSAIFKKYAEKFPYYSSGKNGFVDVRDVVDLLLHLSDNKISAQRFIAVGENISYREIGEKIALAFGQKPPHKLPKTWQINILWQAEKWRSLLFGTQPLLTKETAHSAQSQWTYSNRKAVEKLGFTFRIIDKTIAECAKFYQKTQQ